MACTARGSCTAGAQASDRNAEAWLRRRLEGLGQEGYSVEGAIVVWILFGIGAAIIANSRGANGCLWFGLGVLLGPFALLFAFFTGGKTCPACRSKIHKDATRCPKCQETLA